MWLSSGSFVLSVSILGLAAQVPLQIEQSAHASPLDFNLKEGPNIFSPKDLIQLARPGAGVANSEGDLMIVPVSKYSFNDKK